MIKVFKTSYQEWRRDWPCEARQPLEALLLKWCQFLQKLGLLRDKRGVLRIISKASYLDEEALNFYIYNFKKGECLWV